MRHMRDRCSECLGMYAVRADGMIGRHGKLGNHCPGVGQPPAVMHDPLGPDGWARGLIERAEVPDRG
jgi:hypothetical protein